MKKTIKVILTGATGFVGEGVLLVCIADRRISEILMVNRKHYSGIAHPKVKECIVPDFFDLGNLPGNLYDYDACFYCAGISSSGLSESEYSRITLDTTLHFAKHLLSHNAEMVFCHISGNLADSSEKGKIMWARIKGKTENALMRLSFIRVYNFRPGFMKPVIAQKNVKTYYKIISKAYPLLNWLFPNQVSTMQQVGRAMINSVCEGYNQQILEVKDIKRLSDQ